MPAFRRGYELQIVDDHEAELLAAKDSAGLGADLGHGGAGGVVDHDVERREVVRGLEDLRPLVGLDARRSDVLQADVGLGGEQALRDLGLGHLEREERDGGAVEGGVRGQVQREGRLTHARAGAEDDHLAGTQAKQALVDLWEAGGDAEGAVGGTGLLLELVIEMRHDLVEGLLALAHVAVGDVEKHLLGTVHHFLRVLGGIEGEGGDLRGGLDHLAQGGVSMEHLEVTAPPNESQ